MLRRFSMAKILNTFWTKALTPDRTHQEGRTLLVLNRSSLFTPHPLLLLHPLFQFLLTSMMALTQQDRLVQRSSNAHLYLCGVADGSLQRLMGQRLRVLLEGQSHRSPSLRFPARVTTRRKAVRRIVSCIHLLRRNLRRTQRVHWIHKESFQRHQVNPIPQSTKINRRQKYLQMKRKLNYPKHAPRRSTGLVERKVQIQRLAKEQTPRLHWWVLTRWEERWQNSVESLKPNFATKGRGSG